MFLLSRCVANELLFDRKRPCWKFDLGQGQGHDLIGNGHVAYQSIRIVGWTEVRSFHRSSLSNKSYCQKLLVTLHDLNWRTHARAHAHTNITQQKVTFVQWSWTKLSPISYWMSVGLVKQGTNKHIRTDTRLPRAKILQIRLQRRETSR